MCSSDLLEIADVESTGLEAWELNDDPNDKSITKISLTFGQAFDGSRKVTLKGVMAVESDKPWAKPSRPALVDPYTKFALRTRSPATLDNTTNLP